MDKIPSNEVLLIIVFLVNCLFNLDLVQLSLINKCLFE